MGGSRRWLTLVIVSAALFLVVIDMTVLYTALPSLAQALQTTASEKLWILNAYSLGMAGLMPVFGALGDRLGQRRVFVFGMLAFGAASLLAAFAPSAQVLILARALLAIGGAAMIPATVALIRLTFHDPKEQALAIGIWGSIASGGAAVGPLLGGFLLEHFWWGSVFLINVPVIAVAVTSTLLLVPAYPGQSSQPIDGLSCVQSTVGMVALAFGIKEFAQPEPSLALAAGALGLGVLGLTVFVRRQLRLPFPLVDLRILGTPQIATGILVALVASLTLIGFELALSQRLQLVLEKSPLAAGAFVLPVSLGSFIAGPLAGFVIGRIGVLRVLLAGLLMTVLGLASYVLLRDGAVGLQIIALALCGVGVGSSLTASGSLVISHVSAERAGMAGSLEGVAFEFGGALGVTLFGSLMTGVYLAVLRGSDYAVAAGSSLDEAHLAAQGMAQGQAMLAFAKQAFETGFNAVSLAAAAGLLMLTLWISLRRKRIVSEGSLISNKKPAIRRALVSRAGLRPCR